MHNITKMSDYYSGIEELFNPPLTYSGNYGFPLRALEICSKMENGRNLVQEYFEKNHLKSIYDILEDYKDAFKEIILVSDVNTEGKGRVLKVALEVLTQQISFGLVNDCPNLDADYKTYKSTVLAFFRNYKKAITAMESKDKESFYELISYVENIMARYEINEKLRKEKYGKNYFPMDMREFLEKLRNKIVKFLVVYNQLVEICSKPVDLKELEQLLDLEKFYFVMTKELIEAGKTTERLDGHLPYSFAFAKVYIHDLKLFKATHNYDLKLQVPILIDRVELVTTEVVTTKSLIKEFNELRNRHPEFSTRVIEPVDGVDYQDMEVFNNVIETMEAERKSKKLELSWKLFKKGERETAPSDDISVKPHFPSAEMSKDEKNAELRRRIDFFEATPYAYRVEGINNFAGYIGYIYPNGQVIFERFYKDLSSYELALENATYIMRLDNFLEMSKLSKPEIIEYIKAGNTDVKRRYHTSKWEENITAIIIGKEYDAKTVDTIEELVNSGKIQRKEAVK